MMPCHTIRGQPHFRCQARTVWRVRAVCGRCASGAHLLIGQVARDEYRHRRVVTTRYRPLDAAVA